jgi:tetratricopeptide (TPR) repeat protein
MDYGLHAWSRRMNKSILALGTLSNSEQPTQEFPEDSVSDVSNSEQQSDQIPEVAEWVQRELQIEERDLLWFERLGQTFLEYGLIEQAKEAFQKAKALPKAHWKSGEGLALAYERDDDITLAIEQMEIVVKEQDRYQGPKSENRRDFLRSRERLANWRHCLDPSQVDSTI